MTTTPRRARTSRIIPTIALTELGVAAFLTGWLTALLIWS